MDFGLILKDVVLSLIFGLLGILVMGAGYKIFDWIIPLDFNKELEKNNISVAIVIAGFLIGVAVIVSKVVALG